MGNVARPNRNSMNKGWRIDVGDGKRGRAAPLCAELRCPAIADFTVSAHQVFVQWCCLS